MTGLRDGIARARTRAAEFLDAQRVPWEGGTAWRHDPAHDPHSDPGLLLYGSWAGVHASHLLGLLPGPGDPDRHRMASVLHRFQVADGTFAMPGRTPGVGTGHDAEYDRFHWTNYAWGALRALGVPPHHRPSFLDGLLEPEALGAWLARRDLERPWAEGNTVVNLASFYLLVDEDGDARGGQRFAQMLEWHRHTQRQDTGCWHAATGARTAAPLYAMAGAAHNLHLFHAAGAPVPRAASLVDTTLATCRRGVLSACLDLDRVDILTHLRGHGHRVPEIDRWLRDLLAELLEIQNPDGGFADTYVADQLTYGHRTPATQSVTWITWFRMVTIGMIACALLPGEAPRWAFRTTLGSGYARPGLGTAPAAPPPATLAVSTTRRLLLRARREARWRRQRVTSRVRDWIAGAP